MEAKHTPGPWRVVNYDAGDRSWWSGAPSIQAPEDLDCAIVHWAGFAQEYWRSARGDAEIHANARLIAAAPELLEAAKAAHILLKDGGVVPIDGMCSQSLARAIAKAEGRDLG